jgi:hypothetical protein
MSLVHWMIVHGMMVFQSFHTYNIIHVPGMGAIYPPLGMALIGTWKHSPIATQYRRGNVILDVSHNSICLYDTSLGM